MHINEITDQIIGAGIAVHRALGPGLLESAYQTCFAVELNERDFLLKAKSRSLSFIKADKFIVLTEWISWSKSKLSLS